MIKITQEKETMLIPLYGKALDFNGNPSILNDIKAAEIVKNISYDFSSLKIPKKTNVMMCLRAKLIDELAARVIKDHSLETVLHLGCGLDSRHKRLDIKEANWYEVDFPEVIDIRHSFYRESSKYHMIATSVTEETWIESLATDAKKVVVIAEGLMMYLEEEEIKRLMKRLENHFGDYTIIFDVYSCLTAKHAGNHPSLKRTGAIIKWGIDDPKSVCTWTTHTELLGEYYFTEIASVKLLGKSTQLMYNFAGLFKAAKRAHRVLVYHVGNKNK